MKFSRSDIFLLRMGIVVIAMFVVVLILSYVL